MIKNRYTIVDTDYEEEDSKEIYQRALNMQMKASFIKGFIASCVLGMLLVLYKIFIVFNVTY